MSPQGDRGFESHLLRSTMTQTIILPGYSLKNKDWAESVAKELGSVFVHHWSHWTSEEKPPDWIDVEIEKIKGEIDGKQVNLITKSLGTYFAVRLVKETPSMCQKLILCGIPLNDLSNKEKAEYQAVGQIPAENVLVIQNETDSHGTYAEVEPFVHMINPQITVVSKPRDDHEYPYPEDFKDFLT